MQWSSDEFEIFVSIFVFVFVFVFGVVFVFVFLSITQGSSRLTKVCELGWFSQLLIVCICPCIEFLYLHLYLCIFVCVCNCNQEKFQMMTKASLLVLFLCFSLTIGFPTQVANDHGGDEFKEDDDEEDNDDSKVNSKLQEQDRWLGYQHGRGGLGEYLR